MHILMISDVYFPRVNGVSTSIRTFSQSFLAAGHSVTLIAPEYEQMLIEDFDIIRIPSRKVPFDPEDRLMSRRAIKALIPELKKQGFDLVHIQTPFVAHYAGVEIARALNIPVLTSYHTYFEAYFEKYLPWMPSGLLRKIARNFSKKQCNQVNGFVSPSHQMLDKLREYGASTKAEIIPTGLVLEDFKPVANNNFRQSLGLDENTELLLYVGRVAFEKNIEFLIDVFDQVADRRPGAKLLIAGEGPALPKLKARASALGLEDDILFVGYLERKNALIACYQSSNLFVFASETETQGLVLLEAMACGLPVVSTVCMGTKDVLKNGQGCVIAASSENDFAGKIIALLNDEAEMTRLSEKGREYASLWATEARAQDMLDFYDKLRLTYEQSAQPAIRCVAESAMDS